MVESQDEVIMKVGASEAGDKVLLTVLLGDQACLEGWHLKMQ